MTTKLFVAGLTYETTDAILQEVFAKVGSVVSAKAIIDRTTNQCKGFGFVEMSTEQEAKEAINTLNNTVLSGRTLVVKESTPKV